MPYSNEDPLPEWFRKSEQGARTKTRQRRQNGSQTFRSVVLEILSESPKRAGAITAIHLESVDISSVGYWAKAESVHAGVSISEDAHRHLLMHSNTRHC